MDCIVHAVTKSQTQLATFAFTLQYTPIILNYLVYLFAYFILISSL